MLSSAPRPGRARVCVGFTARARPPAAEAPSLLPVLAAHSPVTMDVAPLDGQHGFGGVVTVTDPAGVDFASLYDIWMEHKGFLLIKGFVDEEHPGARSRGLRA